MDGRLIAIGDIHGCASALERLLDLIEPQPQDTIVTLGDYINRGPDSWGVIDRLLALRSECQTVNLLGNHDEMLLNNRESRTSRDGGRRDPMTGQEVFLDRHFEFLQSCRLFYESTHHLFMHANYDPKREMAEQEPFMLVWKRLRTYLPKRHCSGKTAVVGHTAQRSGEILDLGHLVCVDTCCCGGGWLTGLEVQTREMWQVNAQGAVRNQVAI